MKKIKKRIKRSKLMVYYNMVKRLYFSIKYNIPKKNILQLASTTEYNRHEDLFKLSQSNLGKESKIKVLSFGCSTGEECFSLREYFPNATIIGCDINKDSLHIAAKRNKDNNIEFIISNNSNLHKYKYFDLILANSVFTKQPEDKVINNISKLFPFNQFNEITQTLHSLINRNGLFIMRYSNYKFEDTLIAHKYKCLLQKDSNFPVFDKNGDKLNGINRVCEVFKRVDN